eukprot:6183712-Pleurochrysis_carterae.AAC.2
MPTQAAAMLQAQKNFMLQQQMCQPQLFMQHSLTQQQQLAFCYQQQQLASCMLMATHMQNPFNMVGLTPNMFNSVGNASQSHPQPVEAERKRRLDRVEYHEACIELDRARARFV